ncbi:MAG: hypothetical protein KA712_06510 [Myxococcales bacterium]|nr:hypothetical protein [Myxococcales bacterium]
MGGVDLKHLLGMAKRHSRIAHQDLLAAPEAVGALARALPAFVAFEKRRYAGAFWVFDWDHRLPSKNVVVRLYAYYDEHRLAAGERSFAVRSEAIARQDLFPEFDVPDFGGLDADEAYEAEFEVGGVPPERYRLTSAWRHTVAASVGRRAEEVVRESEAYKVLREAAKDRPVGLGGPESAQWVSPAETGHPSWAVEVWFLRNFNGMVGEGTAFVVDPDASTIVGQRDFQFRAG